MRRAQSKPRYRCRKKTAAAIQREVEREVSKLLRIVFQDPHQSRRLDLEAVEMAMRDAMHQAGAAARSQLLRCEPPDPNRLTTDQREIPYPCGQLARYREMRSRRELTAVGEIEFRRPWYRCWQSHTREMKLGCVFTQTGWDQEGSALRDPDSTTDTGTIETASQLAPEFTLRTSGRYYRR